MAPQKPEAPIGLAHASATYKAWLKLRDLRGGKEVQINGNALDLPSVVAVSRSANVSSLVNLRQTILKVLRHGFTPVIPLRGTVSASGDLLPLAYIGGVVEGSPDIRVCTGKGPTRRIVSAKEALKLAGAKPIELGPKEGLGLINGTAASASVASLALYETHMLAVFSQILTAMAVEALLGNAESFHPFLAEVRPNSGQIEVAYNIRSFLRGSKLAQGLKDDKNRMKSGLVQDRYAVRSASQWVGPQLEDLLLADRQITTELNSTTDNPVIDAGIGEVYSGANFQAACTTSAMEKARLSLQMLGKMLFGQYSELINPSHSNGLPANLAADDPSLSFTMKGVDVNLASYMSELAFLANPVSSHVQSAEMHNQAVNSLALITARYTLHAVELTSLICASCLYVGCQALDLRVMRLKYLETLQPMVETITSTVFGQLLNKQELEKLQLDLRKHIPDAWSATTTLDAHEGFQMVVDTSIGVVTECIAQSKAGVERLTPSIALIKSWRSQMFSALNETYIAVRAEFFEHQSTAASLGHASHKLYTFVRNDLGVPFHRGLVEHPGPKDDQSVLVGGRDKKTIGSWISIIYESLRDGRLHEPIMMCLDFADKESTANGEADGVTIGEENSVANGQGASSVQV
ncbi:MAG: hypothetical protein Q9197_004548 [Variospora fuerteventurae]